MKSIRCCLKNFPHILLQSDDWTPYWSAHIREYLDISESYPEMIVNTFVIPNYLGKYPLTKYKNFCELLNKLQDENKIYVCAPHGYKHERWDVSYELQESYLISALNMLKKSGLSFHHVFKPPAWKYNANTQLLIHKYKFQASFWKTYYTRKLSIIHDRGNKWLYPYYDKLGNLCFPTNFNPGWDTRERAVKIISKGGILSIQTHIYTTTNSILKIKEELYKLFNYLEKRYSKLCFITSEVINKFC